MPATCRSHAAGERRHKPTALPQNLSGHPQAWETVGTVREPPGRAGAVSPGSGASSCSCDFTQFSLREALPRARARLRAWLSR